MLLTGSSFVCPNSIKFPPTKFEKIKGPLPVKFSKCSKTTILLSFSYKENNCFKRNSTKLTASSNSNQLLVEVEDRIFENRKGKIGIDKFFEGKNIFITGGTGFLGKVFVEKLLSSTGVGKIFLLVKAKNKEAACERLTNEIVNSELFKSLKEKHGKCYEAFVRSKLIPIVGNICEPNLGMEHDDVDVLKREVNVIIESAAITTMRGRYDLLLDANVNAPQRLMRFAKTCKNLKLFTHISTAFVNGSREGTILEKPWTMGENARKDDDDNKISSSNLPPLDPVHEMKLAFSSCNSALSHRDQTNELSRLGQERAELYGWNNVYTLTKAMAEMSLNQIRGDVPLLIIRPSIVESSYAEPFPGWIQGFRMSDPVIFAFGKGQFPAVFGVPEATLDFIPVDIVVNTTIAAIAKHGLIGHTPEPSVYHVASSTVNRLTNSGWFELLYEYFTSTPLIEQAVEKIKFIDNFNDYSVYTRDEIFRRHAVSKYSTDDPKKVKNQLKARAGYAEYLCKIYDFIGFFNARFHTGNTQELLREMSEEEKINFSIDVTKIDWRKYFVDIHIPGVMKHLINGTDSNSQLSH